MEATQKRRIRSGDDVDHLFPKPIGEDELIKKGATVEDTVEFIPEVVEKTLSDTKKIAQELQGKTLFDTCKNIWHFVYGYIAYEKDEKGKEQIRRPARSWANRARGVDCDDYSVFISSVLTNLGIPHSLRVTKYWWTEGKYSHIYPIVHTPDNKEIVIDCVVNRFNYEEPYTEKKDKKMDLYYLNGIERPSNIDADDLTNGGMIDLGKTQGKVGAALKKGLHAINKVNPATLLLRAGVLASMKLNVMGVAEKLRFAYLSDEEAKKRGYDMAKFAKLKSVREKTEKIFYGAGGKPENLKEAILTGKGNASKEVSGLGAMDASMPLREIIGQRAYTSEIEALEGLGEPATAAALAAASAVIASLAAILKNIGGLKGTFKQNPTDAASVTENLPAENTNTALEPGLFTEDAPIQNRSATDTTSTDDSNKDTWWSKNKKWALPTGIGIGVLGLAYGGYQMMKSDKPKKSTSKNGGLSGVKRKYKSKKRGKKKSHKKVHAVRWK
jgi:hypothetical protein